MSEQFSIDRLVAVYVKMRDKKKRIQQEADEQIAVIEADMKKVEAAILSQMRETGAESIRTQHGTVSRSVKTRFMSADWNALHKFILERACPELLENRIHQTNMRAYLEENPQDVPPGVLANSEYTISVRRGS